MNIREMLRDKRIFKIFMFFFKVIRCVVCSKDKVSF